MKATFPYLSLKLGLNYKLIINILLIQLSTIDKVNWKVDRPIL